MALVRQTPSDLWIETYNILAMFVNSHFQEVLFRFPGTILLTSLNYLLHLQVSTGKHSEDVNIID